MALSVIRVLSLTTSRAEILFSDDLDTNIGVANVSVTTTVESVSNPIVSSVSVEDDVLTVQFRPMFPGVYYFITFSSTDTQSFQTINGELIFEDGKRNIIQITSPGEEENTIRDSMLESMPIVYETEQPSMVRDLIGSISDSLQKVDDAIQTTEAANYISITVENEQKTRGDGPVDKFDNGGVYEVTRVASNSYGDYRTKELEFSSYRSATFQTRSNTIVNYIVDDLPGDPITLQAVDKISETVTDDIDQENYFTGLTINVANGPVVQVISVTLKRNGQYIPYNVNQFGYTIQDNRYDTTIASRNVNLGEREINLSSSAITGESGAFVLPAPDDEIIISYIYKKLGRNINQDEIQLSSIKEVSREATPAVTISFSLDHAPIVSSTDAIPTTGGVEFLNAVAFDGNPPLSVAHPAFTNEIPYDTTRTPSKPGDYSVNYETGEVLVFGEDINAQGTGESPPLANYLYRKIYTENIDYTFDADIDELAIRSSSGIIGTEAKITFEYEDIFADGVDFDFLSHIESLNERVNNRLVGAYTVQTENFPITDVFRVFNETTGEIYTIDRFNDTSISFSGRRAPEQVEVERERINFSREPQEVLYVSDRSINSSGLNIFTIDLSNRGITDTQRNFIGANFDNSVLFSREDIFIREKFHESELYDSVTQNVNKLTAIGEFMIDYENGIVYIAVSSTQSDDIGDISYEYKDIVTRQDHVLSVNGIYRSVNSADDNIEDFLVGNITDTTVNISNLGQIGERFINGNSTRPLLVGTYQSGEDGITTNGSTSFVSNSATFTTSDIGRILIIGSSNKTPVEQVSITGVINSHELIISPAASYTGTGRVWNIVDLSSGARKTITVENNITSIRNIYLVSQLGSLPFDELDGYYDINLDSFENNVITLDDSNGLDVGDAVIVVYNFGNLYIDYKYLKDDLLISYEYGNNSLNWSISNALKEGEEYYVTYKYGALRESLLANFGSLTQIPLLTNFPSTFDREVYRSVVGGTLQSFVEGPTIPSIERLVESFTGVTPDIRESAFDDWILGRDYLHLRGIETAETANFDNGKFNNGLLVDGDQVVTIPALAHFRANEGTLSTWVKPSWNGIDNNSTLTFDLEIDGYSLPNRIYIGISGTNPEEIPFSISKDDSSVFGIPNNIDTDTGYFIWYDEFNEQWNIRWREDARYLHSFSGEINTTGEFFNVSVPETDGYDINEASDLITTTTNQITFEANIDCADFLEPGEDAYWYFDGGPLYNPVIERTIDGGTLLNTTFFCVIDGGDFTDSALEYPTERLAVPSYSEDGLSFSSGDEHFIIDLGESEDYNRVSLFKDGTGYLNFRVLDNELGNYTLSTDISDWAANSLHHVAVSWKFNSPEDMDFMHLFVDGQETFNLYKYGGKPASSITDKYGDVAEEIISSSATSPIVGGFDGSSESGSDLFISQGVDFESLGILVGSSFRILDDVPDGTQDPVTGGIYTITGVGQNTVTLDRTLTSTLGNISFAVNQLISTVSTNINFQDFAVLTIDGYGNETELNGLDADEPYYSISRGDFGYHRISINNGVAAGDKIVIRPLGLNFRRCKDKIFVYGDGDNKIRANMPPPVSLQDVDITKVIMNTSLIEEGTIFKLISGSLFASFGGDGYHSLVADGYVFQDGYVCQPSNQVNGRTLAVKLSGDNIDYSVSGNNIIKIIGDTFSGITEETLTFDDNNIIITNEYWRNIEAVEVTVIPIDTTLHAGIIEIKENKPMNEIENLGDFAEITDFSNGIFTLEVYGSGGEPFNIESCYYEIDFPSFLKIDLLHIPDNMYLGSDIFGNNQFDGVIDEIRINKTAKTDTRAGEAITVDSITFDYNSVVEFETNNDTILLTHFNDTLDDESNYIDAFDEGFEVAESVNDNFETALLITDNRPYEVDNSLGVFNNNAGTIEFWVSPLEDNQGDPNLHYYVDITTAIVEEVTSVTKLNLTLSQRASEIESVRLLTDTNNTGTNFFTGGSINQSNRSLITLGIPLPAQNVTVKVSYIPLNSNGDRVSIFKDGDGFVNFYIKASGTEHLISSAIDWSRNTWHRIMAMWDLNNSNNLDRMRLFTDGSERGTIKYGTGLIYGTGVIYGQAEIRPGQNRFLRTNIDLTDTFAKIFIGTNFERVYSARARIDNVRFSNIERLNAISVVGGDTIDVNYISNTSMAEPVFEDLNTSLILDFNKEMELVEFFTTLINSERGIFRFEVDVIDSFDRVIGDTTLENLLVDLINVIKPAHTESIINFVE